MDTMRLPLSAGAMSSRSGSVMLLVTKGEAVWKTQLAPATHLVRVRVRVRLGLG